MSKKVVKVTIKTSLEIKKENKYKHKKKYIYLQNITKY